MAPDTSKRLITFGWLSAAGKKKKKEVEEKGGDWMVYVDSLTEDKQEELADHHLVEIAHNQMLVSDYPKPEQSYHVIYESYSRPLESYYFWAMNHFNDLMFGHIEKITDIFAASEQSALFGSSAQRLGLAQDKVTNFLVSIGRLVKDLFAMVRELRIMDERLEFYQGVKSPDPKIRDINEVALKSLYVELVEGGAKNVNSVYGLARELQFVTLPDLFFSVHPQSVAEIADTVNKLDFNNKVKEVLAKKLMVYLNWREKTGQEQTNRRSHLIKYLRQHYDAIQLYLTWVRPYLKHIKRLGTQEKFLDSKDLIAAFEGAMMEIEVMAYRKVADMDDVYAIILLNFLYRTSPTMPFQGGDYKQGPLHMGKMEVRWRSYAWGMDEINRYKSMRNVEGFEMLASIDVSIKQAMEELGASLKKYLLEAGERFEEKELSKKEPPKEKPPSILDPFLSIPKGIGEMFGGLIPSVNIKSWFSSEAEKKYAEEQKRASNQSKASGIVKVLCTVHWKNFKKAHGFVTW